MRKINAAIAVQSKNVKTAGNYSVTTVPLQMLKNVNVGVRIAVKLVLLVYHVKNRTVKTVSQSSCIVTVGTENTVRTVLTCFRLELVTAALRQGATNALM